MGYLKHHQNTLSEIEADSRLLMDYYRHIEQLENALKASPMALAASNSFNSMMDVLIKKRDETPVDWVQDPAVAFPPSVVQVETLFGFYVSICCRDESSLISEGYLSSETSETLLLLKAAEFAETFFDVGANVGVYSLLMAAAADPPFNAYAFEPVSDTFRRFQAAIDANHYKERINAFRYAIGSQRGKAHIKIHRHGSGGSSLSDDFSQASDYSGHTESVQQMPLDDFIEDNRISPGFGVLKVDTEGFEIEVLKGASRYLGSSNPPVILIETLPYNTHNDRGVLQILSRMGYEVYGIRPFEPHRKLLYPAFSFGRLKRVKSGNYIAFHQGHNELRQWCLQPESTDFIISQRRLERICAFQRRSIKAAEAYGGNLTKNQTAAVRTTALPFLSWEDFKRHHAR